MKITAIIPARMASTRFPGKPLEDILGLPMIEHVRRRVLLHPDVNSAIVATCDKEIFDIVMSNGGESIMTSSAHFCCNDRVSEAAVDVDADIIVNVQGDEPLFNPEMISSLVEPMKNDNQIICTNLMSRIETEEEFCNPNEVKVVCDLNSDALYMSREPVPSAKKTNLNSLDRFKQLGVYAFRKSILQKFASWSPSPLEIIETIDMLRLLQHGYKVRMIDSPFKTIGVDTPQDLEVAIELLSKDHLFGTY
jgi:3-deoxy-manno-octulosonate cytidylyltransferase (CMP-KDO synthetase)